MVTTRQLNVVDVAYEFVVVVPNACMCACSRVSVYVCVCVVLVWYDVEHTSIMAASWPVAAIMAFRKPRCASPARVLEYCFSFAPFVTERASTTTMDML